jgi:23S rRNA (cytosine1962-C5)-methyltransferase
MSQACLVLKPGKERPIQQRHHWIYSGAIRSLPNTNELVLPVYSAQGEKLGLAAINRGRSIAAHMLAFGEETLEESLRRRIREAFVFRKRWFDPRQTNAFRVIHAEGDGIPGLVVDSYDGMLVMQISHAALEAVQPLIQSLLIEEMQPSGIYEKSTSFLRKKEGLEEVRMHRYGEQRSPLTIRENGLQFRVDLEQGQKTGWFLDQRESRELIRRLASGKRVLNLFSYTGGFSLAALAGGAEHVTSVEISEKCEHFLEEHLALNRLDRGRHRFICHDVFHFLQKEEALPYDLIILDPPAFAKNRTSVPAAFRAYKDLNRVVLERAPSSALVLTCSCSYQIDETLFQNILFRAAQEAKRSVQIISRHHQAIDHPIAITHPESAYLKSFLLNLI